MPPGSEKRSCDSHVTYLYFIDHVVCDVLFVPVYMDGTRKISYSHRHDGSMRISFMPQGLSVFIVMFILKTVTDGQLTISVHKLVHPGR